MKKVATRSMIILATMTTAGTTIPAATAEVQVVRSFNSLNECENHRAKHEPNGWCQPWKDTSAWALWADVRNDSFGF